MATKRYWSDYGSFKPTKKQPMKTSWRASQSWKDEVKSRNEARQRSFRRGGLGFGAGSTPTYKPTTNQTWTKKPENIPGLSGTEAEVQADPSQTSLLKGDVTDADIQTAGLKATAQTKYVIADYNTAVGQLEQQRKSQNRAGAIARRGVEERAARERVLQAIGASSAGVGSSGAASQFTQDLAIRKEQTLGEFREQSRKQSEWIENTLDLKRRELLQKAMADESFADNLGGKTVSDNPNSFSIGADTLSAIQKINPKVSPKDVVSGEMIKKLQMNVKDDKKRKELMEMYAENWDAISEPFTMYNNLEISTNTRNGNISYYNADTGAIMTTTFEKNNRGQWVPKPNDNSVSASLVQKVRNQLPSASRTLVSELTKYPELFRNLGLNNQEGAYLVNTLRTEPDFLKEALVYKSQSVWKAFSKETIGRLSLKTSKTTQWANELRRMIRNPEDNMDKFLEMAVNYALRTNS